MFESFVQKLQLYQSKQLVIRTIKKENVGQWVDAKCYQFFWNTWLNLVMWKKLVSCLLEYDGRICFNACFKLMVWHGCSGLYTTTEHSHYMQNITILPRLFKPFCFAGIHSDFLSCRIVELNQFFITSNSSILFKTTSFSVCQRTIYTCYKNTFKCIFLKIFMS